MIAVGKVILDIKNKTPEKFIPFFLFFIAFAIRYHFLKQNFGLYDSPGKYEWAAKKIISGEDAGQRILDFSPLYTYVNVVFQYLFFGNRFFLILFQNLLGSINSVFIYLIGKRLFSKPVGIIAGIMFVWYKNIILYEYIFEPITVVLFINSLLILTLIVTADRIVKKVDFLKTVLLCFASGVLLGLGAITRPNILLFFPVAGWWIFISWKKGDRKNICLAAYYFLFCIGIITTLSPIIARNYKLFNKVSLVIMSPGQVFHQGNYREASGLSLAYPPVLTDIYHYKKEDGSDYMHEMYRIVARHSIGKDITFEESSRFWIEKAINSIAAYPGEYIKILLNKGLSFFNPLERHDIPMAFPKQNSLKQFPFLTIFILIPLSILGIFTSLKRRKNILLPLCMILVYFLSNLVFFVSSRQRLPAVPFFFLFSAYYIICFFRFLRDKNYKAVFLSLILFGILVSIISFPYSVIQSTTVKLRRLYTVYFSSTLYKVSTSVKNNNYALASREIKSAAATYPLKIKEFAAGSIFYGDEGLVKGAITIAEDLFPPEKNNQYENFYLGYLYLLGEEYGKAEDIFTRSENYIMLGNSSLSRGRFDRAIDYYETALENKEFNLAALAHLSALYSKKNHPEKSLSLLHDLRLFYDDISIAYHLGMGFYMTDEYEKAIAEWKKVAGLFPDYPPIHVLLSRAYAKGGVADTAYKEYEIAITLKPSLFIKLKELEAVLEKKREKTPGEWKLYWRSGRLYEGRGDFKKALQVYLKALNLLKNKDLSNSSDRGKIRFAVSRIYYGLGDYYLVSKETDRAAHYLEKAKKFNYQEAELYMKLGYAYQEKGMIEEAIKNYSIYLTLKPDDSETHKVLGNLYYTKKEYNNSEIQYKKCITFNREDADCYYNLGLVYVAMNRFANAIHNYTNAIDLTPDEPDFHYNLGIVYKKTGKRKKAEDEFRIADRL